MNGAPPSLTHVAIACGGTGGHLFPGLAVAQQLHEHGCALTLLVSPKEVDQQGIRQAAGMKVMTLPGVGLSRGRGLAFMRGFLQSYHASKKSFVSCPPKAALAMGGFTSAPPVLAARSCGALTFLHESNTIPGRANRWLSWLVDRAFVGFPSAAGRLHSKNTAVTGTPVRPQFRPVEAASCRRALGLAADRPTILVMGGSQGASGVNQLVFQALPQLAQAFPQSQWVHLTGAAEAEPARRAYASSKLSAVVHPFFEQMGLVLGAATLAVSRAGASSLAELAAMCVPAILVPYPAAADNHQLHNARAFEQTGAACVLEQKHASPSVLAELVTKLIRDTPARERMQGALGQWHHPDAAAKIAQAILEDVSLLSPTRPLKKSCRRRRKESLKNEVVGKTGSHLITDSLRRLPQQRRTA